MSEIHKYSVISGREAGHEHLQRGEPHGVNGFIEYERAVLSNKSLVLDKKPPFLFSTDKILDKNGAFSSSMNVAMLHIDLRGFHKISRAIQAQASASARALWWLNSW